LAQEATSYALDSQQVHINSWVGHACGNTTLDRSTEERLMRKAFKYRIYLTNGQRRILEQQLEECRWTYNETLAERKRAFEERGESLGVYDTINRLPVWKMARPALKLVHSQVLQNVCVRVNFAFQGFFRRVKEGAGEVGYPRFKSFGRYDSITYPQYGNGVRLDRERLILSKVGAVPVVLHRPIEGMPKTVTLTRTRTKRCLTSTRTLRTCTTDTNIDFFVDGHPRRQASSQPSAALSVTTLKIGRAIRIPMTLPAAAQSSG